jgi:hypothetical protein
VASRKNDTLSPFSSELVGKSVFLMGFEHQNGVGTGAAKEAIGVSETKT